MRADRLVDAMRIDEVGPRDEGKITVQFKTFLPREFVVAETPFEVPSEFARLGVWNDCHFFFYVMKKPVLLLRDS